MFNKVYVEITNTCNMNCSFCHGHNRKPRLMNTEEFLHILDKIKNKTKYIYYHLMGEPLTHPLLPKFIDLANEQGYKSIITTNDTLLSKREKEILSSNVYRINISLHSFENGTDEQRFKYFREVIDFSKKASACGIIICLRLWNTNVDDGNNKIIINLLKESFPNEWDVGMRGTTLQDNVYLEWGERFEWPDINAQIKGNKFYCYGLKDQFGILVDGTVVPCCLDSDGIINLGNIYDADVDSILNSSRAKNMVNGFKCGLATEELCKKCGYAQKFI